MKIAAEMAAENRRIMSGRGVPLGLGGREVLFTPEQARRALPYVARLAADAAAAFRVAQNCRRWLERAPSEPGFKAITEQRDTALERLNSVIDEANAVGADLVDIPRGVVRFHGIDNARRVKWHWTLGEPMDGPWPAASHALDAKLEAVQAASA